MCFAACVVVDCVLALLVLRVSEDIVEFHVCTNSDGGSNKKKRSRKADRKASLGTLDRAQRGYIAR